MRTLDIDPDVHFADAEYGGSEVLIYHWDRDAGRVLLCCTDLSEKIAHWAYGTEPPDYAARYRVCCFLDVRDYRRSGVLDSWQSVRDDFVITREDLRVTLDDIGVSVGEDGLTVAISFERGFGEVAFASKAVTVSELTTYAAPGPDGTTRQVVEADGKTPFDEDEFLTKLYRSGPGAC